MQLKHINIENIGGIEYLEFPTAGALIEVSGSNGQGKTSVLNALRCVVEGGHNPALLRVGAKKGVVKLLLDDGTTITRTITEKASRTEVTTRDGQIIPAPQGFVNELCAGFAFEPTSLISASAKERTAFLLSAMPITFTGKEIAATGYDGVAVDADLDGLASMRDGVFNTRKALNKTVRDADGTIASLRQGMPAEDGTDWTAKGQELEAKAAELEVAIRDEEREATEEYTGIVDVLTAKRDGIVADLQAKIQLAREQCQRDMSVAINGRDAMLKNIAERAKPARDRLATEKAQAWERSQAAGKALGARQTIEAMQVRSKADFVESERLTLVLENLDALRRRKLDELPIPGVELKDGEVYVSGVPFEQLNTAQQFALSIRLAKLKLGRLPLLVIDHGEAFDADTWEAFRDSAKESGLQIVVARVDEGPLRVAAS